ncbi:MAG TPA: calcium/sodium antiporter [Paracoccaceae bacterium]|nr:calcium/sodium antiporter [Paracoccaceae bacterium]
MLLTSVLLIVGLTLLVIGGELLVRGAVRIAAFLGMSPMLVGLTVVGMGTSAPELAASVQASMAGSPGIALGNIVGSNMANLLLILGISALLAPLAVQRGVLWRDGGVGVLATLAMIAAGYTLGLDRIAGTLFLCATAGYIYYAYNQERAGGAHGAVYGVAMAAEEIDPALVPLAHPRGSLIMAILTVLAGLAVIVGGGKLLVDNAIVIAADLGVTDAVIGLTVVAVGTSLPELVTSVIAALRKHSEIALGNVLGSSIFNMLFIGGATGLLAPAAIPESILRLDLWLALAAALAVMLFAYTGGKLSRREGLILVGLYLAYTLFTVGAF